MTEVKVKLKEKDKNTLKMYECLLMLKHNPFSFLFLKDLTVLNSFCVCVTSINKYFSMDMKKANA